MSYITQSVAFDTTIKAWMMEQIGYTTGRYKMRCYVVFIYPTVQPSIVNEEKYTL